VFQGDLGTGLPDTFTTDVFLRSFNTKYAILAATLHDMVPGAKQDFLHEGVNDQGMTFTVNALMGNSSAVLDANAPNVLAATDMGTWALGNYQNVTQVKQALQSKEVSVWLPRIPSMAKIRSNERTRRLLITT